MAAHRLQITDKAHIYSFTRGQKCKQQQKADLNRVDKFVFFSSFSINPFKYLGGSDFLLFSVLHVWDSDFLLYELIPLSGEHTRASTGVLHTD